MAISEKELWACALQVLSTKGELADDFVAERVETLARGGDLEGVGVWRAIAERIDRLRDVETRPVLN